MSIQTTPRRVSIAPVGRSFLLYNLRKIQFANEQKASNHHHAQDQNKKNKNQKNQNQQGKQKNKKKKSKQDNIELTIDWDCDLDDYYALLGIKKYEMNISQESVKKIYRKVSLLCHPDKVDESHRKQAETRFKLLQLAFDELTDPYSKILYDSQIDFDSSIPTQDMLLLLQSKSKYKQNKNNNKLESNDNNKTETQLRFEEEFGSMDEVSTNEDIWDDSSEGNDQFFKVRNGNSNDDSNADSLETRFVFFKDIINNGNESSFYTLFEPYFTKYSQYSKKNQRDVPKFGNSGANEQSIRKFYTFWFKFDSWRMFLHIVEKNGHVYDHKDIKDAENNKERKWMMRENDKMQAHLKKEESLSIDSLVRMAFLRDPRVTRFVIKNKLSLLAKEREIINKKLAKQREIEEKELADHIRKEELKLAAIRESKKQAQLERAAQKEIMELPIKFRHLCNNEYFSQIMKIKSDDIDLICFNCNFNDIKDILNCGKIDKNAKTTGGQKQADKDDRIKLQYSKYLEKLEIAKKNKLIKMENERLKQKKKNDKLKSEGKGVWSMDEISLLWNGVSRYPGGTIDRWGRITAIFNGKRSQEEVIKKVKQLSKKQRKPNNNNTNNNSNNSGNNSNSNIKNYGGSSGNNNNNNNSKSKNKSKNKEKDEQWSGVEQKALEEALRQVRTLPASEKWDKVAEIVGKPKEECIQRFKYIRTQLLAKKQQQQSKKT